MQIPPKGLETISEFIVTSIIRNPDHRPLFKIEYPLNKQELPVTKWNQAVMPQLVILVRN